MGDLRSFLRELKRRKVVRTAIAYGVVAGGVLSVADIVWENLPLPPGGMTFLVILAILGFPVVVVLEWVFEDTSEGVRRTPDDAAESAGRSALIRPVVAGAILVLLTGSGAWLLRDHLTGDVGDEVPPDRTAVAILPFEVRGSPDLDYLREGMVDLLSTKLQGAEVLEPLDPRTVLAFLDYEELDPRDPATGGAVAARFGAGRVLRGSVVEHEGAVQVRATLYRVGEDEPEVQAAAEGDGNLFPLVDELAGEILAGTGGTGRLSRLAALTTDSLPALKAYLRGERSYRRGQYNEAIGMYREAVEIDTSFALAYYRIGNAASWAEQRHIAQGAAAAAMRLNDRLRTRDRRLVEALAARLRGNHAEAIRLARGSVELYPDDVEALYELGEVLFHEGYLSGQDPDAAHDAFEQAARLDPESVPVLQHLGWAAAFRGDHAQLDSLTDRLTAINRSSSFPTLRGLHLGDATVRDSILADLAGEAQPTALWVFASLAPTPAVGEGLATLLTDPRHRREWREVGWAMTALAQADGARWRAAFESLEELARLDEALALEVRGYLTLLAPPEVAAEELESLHTALLEWDGTGRDPEAATPAFSTPHAGLHPYLRHHLLGLVEARLGRSEAALGRAEELERIDPPPETREYLQDLAIVIRAEVAREQDDAERALEILQQAPLWTSHPLDERASPLVGHYYAVFLRGELLKEMDRLEQALRWYRPFNMIVQVPPATLALHRRAEIFRLLGEDERARELARRVRERWARADPTG